MINPEARRRLADLMDRRRADLRLTWREVSKAGGVSYEALRAARNGTADIRTLTRAGIEDGLHWERGSIARVLEGGEPAPAGARSRIPATPADAAGAAEAMDVTPAPRPDFTDGDDADPALRDWNLGVITDMYRAVGVEFINCPGRPVPDDPELEAIVSQMAGSLIFPHPRDREFWDTDNPPKRRRRLIARMRRLRAEWDAEQRNPRSGLTPPLQHTPGSQGPGVLAAIHRAGSAGMR